MAGLWIDNNTERDEGEPTSVRFMEGNVDGRRSWKSAAGDIVNLACIGALLFMLALAVSLLQ